MARRCEHNCHLCEKEWLGRCFGTKHYGMSVSMKGNRDSNRKEKGEWADGDLPICEEYKYNGSPEHFKKIEKAMELGVTELNINSVN